MATANSKLVCVRCGYTRTVGKCANCGNDSFDYKSYASFGNGSLDCLRCNDYMTHWDCPSCGTKNPVSKSLKDCFIVTAVYGGMITPEVNLLRSFRDEILKKNIIGRLVINMYERTSPPLAELASKNRIVRLLLDKFLVTPSVRVVKHVYKKS